MSEDEKKDTVEAEKTEMSFTPSTASISYTSAFPKKQLEFAKISRDRAGEIEALFDGNEEKVPQKRKQEHQKEVISAVTNSIAFLKGQKHWFRIKLNKGEIQVQNRDEIEENVSWRDTEDAFFRAAEIERKKDSRIKEGKAYKDVKALRCFRNTLEHFKPVHRSASEDYTSHEEFRKNAEEFLRQRNFSKNELGTNSAYPFNWLTYEMAERSVRMSFHLWRSFAKELGKEDKFLKGVPRP